MDRATIQCPTVGTVTGVEYPIPRAKGTADQFRGAGGRMVLPAGGLAVWGLASLLTGSGVLRAGPLIIPSLIGEGRPGAGAIRNQEGASVPMPRPTYPLRGRESYNTHVSCCLSSATAAWIAAVIVAIRVIFAAGLRSKVAPISSAKIFSVASIASTARSVAVFMGRRSGASAAARCRSMDYQSPLSDLANPRRDVRGWCDRGERGHTERSANANSPSGPANGRGATPTCRRGQPVGSAMRRHARSRPAGARERPPVSRPRRPDRPRMQGATRAFLSPNEPETGKLR